MADAEIGVLGLIQSSDEAQICKRCNQDQVVITLRQQTMCKACFAKYLNSKFRKMMDPFRVGKISKEALKPRRVAVALSLGSSSVAMWSWVVELVRHQLERTNMTGFEPMVVFVDESCLDPSLPSSEQFKAVEQQFSGYIYKTVRLESVYEYSALVTELSNANDEFEATVMENEGTTHQLSNKDKLRKLVSLLESRSSQLDIINVLRTRLLVEVAKKEGCEALLLGDSTTRLAEKTFAETAKGRGHAIPWLVSDGPTPYGISFIRPLRELHRYEILAYTKLTSLNTLCTSPPLFKPENHSGPTTSRHISLDELMSQYFTEVEAKQPNIVANVVKTASRLLPLRSNELPTSDSDDGLCDICGLPRDDTLFGWSNRRRMESGIEETDADAANRRSAETYRLANRQDTVDRSRQCYGCARALRGTTEDLEWPLLSTGVTDKRNGDSS